MMCQSNNGTGAPVSPSITFGTNEEEKAVPARMHFRKQASCTVMTRASIIYI